MSRAPHLSYHREVFELLGLDAPPLSAPALAALGRREVACGVPFPESVREWYAIEGGAGLLDEYGQKSSRAGVSAVALRALGRPVLNRGFLRLQCTSRFDFERLAEIPTRDLDFAATGILVFLRTNGGHSLWGVQLDGTENPPVVVAGRDAIAGAVEADDVTWQPGAESFSAFLYTIFWDRLALGRGSASGVGGWDDPLDEGDVAPLRAHFSEAPTTRDVPAATTYRFFDADGRLHIRNNPGLTRVSYWWLGAANLAALQRLALRIARLRPSLRWLRSGGYGLDGDTSAFVERLQGRIGSP